MAVAGRLKIRRRRSRGVGVDGVVEGVVVVTAVGMEGESDGWEMEEVFRGVVFTGMGLRGVMIIGVDKTETDFCLVRASELDTI